MSRRALLMAAAWAPFARAEEGVRPRSAWGANPAKPGGRPHVATRFTLHHTAGPCVGSDRAAKTLRGIQGIGRAHV